MKVRLLIILVIILGMADLTVAGDLFRLSRITAGSILVEVDDSVRQGDTLEIDRQLKSQAFNPDTVFGAQSRAALPDRPKKPWPTGALFRSAIIPGWGQVYNKQYLKAVLYGGTEIVLAYTTAHYWKQMDSHQRNFMNSTNKTYQAQEYFYYQNSRDNRNLFLWLSGLTFFVSIFDAYVDAHFADYDLKDKAFDAFLAPKNDGLYLSLSFNLK